MMCVSFFYIHTAHLDIIKVFYLPSDAQLNCLKNNFKIYIKIDTKTAPTCFSAITIIKESISALISFSRLGPNEQGFTVWAKTYNYGRNLVDLCCFAL
jgi:hypothetical protein